MITSLAVEFENLASVFLIDMSYSHENNLEEIVSPFLGLDGFLLNDCANEFFYMSTLVVPFQHVLPRPSSVVSSHVNLSLPCFLNIIGTAK